MSDLPAQGRCMFCNMPVFEETETRTPDDRETCSEVPTKAGGRVGDKLICQGCCAELVTMLKGRLES
jgi:hypothetical protein